jgi:cysteinyl-tRNA synthetase
MTLSLFNTESRSIEAFKSIEERKVGLYTCGPTVYHYAHIGNLRTYIFEDILKRVLERRGYDVKHVMNVTDVGHLTDDADRGEDKMEVGAAREGKTVWDIASHYTQAFETDLEKLNIKAPTVWCKATDHISEQIEMVRVLEEKGFTYSLADGVYFDTSKFSAYGKMAGLDLEGQMAGHRVEQTEGKRTPSDFCVWKSSPKGEKRLMEWESPWGTGFPGWHLECSAMALKYLGEQFDIHCGGVDHVRVHHTNEIAQTEACTGKTWVNWWMHGEFLLMDEGKMSKSADNFLTISLLEEQGFDPLAYRLYLMSAHYRKALTYHDEVLKGSQKALERLRGRAQELEEGDGEVDARHLKAFEEALDDDLNMPQAISHMWMMLQDENISDPAKRATLLSMDEILCLDPFKIVKKEAINDEAVLNLIKERNAARNSKDFTRSDAIRDELLAMDIVIKDSPEGTTFERKL